MADTNIGTRNVWPYYSQENVQRAGSGDKNKLGKDEFLKILITQLKNQDPMQPLQDKEFIAQMAQFTSVEQLTNMANELKFMRQSLGFASSLIGKNVTWSLKNDKGQEVASSGLVEAIKVRNGEQLAVINGQEISLDRISKITNPEETP
ncbi:flagellar hook capping FlgD N-terminal domain-containing protein [Paenibacillus sp. GD4]|uniref:flagellar hook capping FlgD N-terminal domain-containing protein n=1 Tax=Paenibacillus sp. GD4 TaxID=3068890 RepID=UPI0027964B35|nr:flagellar hook capping FlgD N-terminal domain-containing protein [Paenibacillus sp. GD4]MDQ1913312.1 flagellar hook capping FlgD N-terminal domain-containing protein [Paenibacillus sp. GD4]